MFRLLAINPDINRKATGKGKNWPVGRKKEKEHCGVKKVVGWALNLIFNTELDRD